MSKMQSMRESTNYLILEEDSNLQLREDQNPSDQSQYRCSQSSQKNKDTKNAVTYPKI